MIILKKISYVIFYSGLIIIILISIYPITKRKIQKDKIMNEKLNYIEIPAVGIINMLVFGITDDHLNMDVAAMEFWDTNQIVAGHAVNHVFYNLKYSNIGDEIIINYNSKNKYIIKDKYIVNVNEFNGFEEKNSLILITCINETNRLIIIAEKK